MRRHDLDWLRVLVFALLIFYHVGMLFVPWDFHIKNNNISSKFIYPMLFINQWRLPILFVISGMGTFFAFQKRNGKQFVLERLKRLGIPLCFGMLFIIPPQVYLERLDKNQFIGNYLDFWPSQAFLGIYPSGNLSWHHLWFLPYLLLFSLVLTPVFLYLQQHSGRNIDSWLSRITKNPFGLYGLIIPLYFIEVFIKPHFPVTHALIDDWYAVFSYFIFFIWGFLLMLAKDAFWSTVVDHRHHFFIIGIICFITLVFMGLGNEHIHMPYLAAVFKVLNQCSWVLVLFGYAAKYLNKKSKVLSYSNQAVYPFYILHQTLMLILAYYLINLQWSITLKALLLVSWTFGFSLLLYEFCIRRSDYLRLFFGLKNKNL